MPGHDRTGPLGNGPKTGRSMGRCTRDSLQNGSERGLGNNFRCMGGGRKQKMGFRNRGRNFLTPNNQNTSKQDK